MWHTTAYHVSRTSFPTCDGLLVTWQVCIATEESYFILKYSPEEVAKAQETKDGVTEDGVEDALDVSRPSACPNACCHERWVNVGSSLQNADMLGILIGCRVYFCYVVYC